MPPCQSSSGDVCAEGAREILQCTREVGRMKDDAVPATTTLLRREAAARAQAPAPERVVVGGDVPTTLPAPPPGMTDPRRSMFPGRSASMRVHPLPAPTPASGRNDEIALFVGKTIGKTLPVLAPRGCRSNSPTSTVGADALCVLTAGASNKADVGAMVPPRPLPDHVRRAVAAGRQATSTLAVVDNSRGDWGAPRYVWRPTRTEVEIAIAVQQWATAKDIQWKLKRIHITAGEGRSGVC